MGKIFAPYNLVNFAVLAFATQCSAQTAPAFVWTSSEALFAEGGLSANYEVIDSSQFSKALLQLEQQSTVLQELKPRDLGTNDGRVTVLISGQATRSTLTQHTPETLALRSSLESAASALYLPNVLPQGGFDTDSNAFQIGNCQFEGQEIALDQLKSKVDGQSLTIRVCEDESSPHIAAVEAVLVESKQPYVMAYLGQSDKSAERPAARSLLQAPATQKLCSEKCQTQVMLFECIILLVILLSALWIGMNMLHILDTPSRFETEKKEQSRHQD